jgi:biotin operon repressor
MAKRHNKTGRSKRDGQYIPLPYSMLRHPAWRRLNPAAIKVWLELRSRYNGSNNGKLALSVDQGAKLLGMSKSTVTRALKELEAKGFIVKTRQGAWYGRKATEWRVTDTSCDGHPPSRDWQRLTTDGGKKQNAVPR